MTLNMSGLAKDISRSLQSDRTLNKRHYGPTCLRNIFQALNWQLELRARDEATPKTNKATAANKCSFCISNIGIFNDMRLNDRENL